jgi:uncharacterized membrane protein YciS (DUF1049 family)
VFGAGFVLGAVLSVMWYLRRRQAAGTGIT